MDLKAIDKLIASIRTRGAKLDKDIQTAACAIIGHAMGEGAGDVTRALTLVLAMPKGSRRATLIRWFAAYSPISISVPKDIKKARVGLRKREDANYQPFNLDGATNNNWWEHEREQLEDAMLEWADIEKKVINLKEFLVKRADEGKVKDKDAVLKLAGKLTQALKVA